MAKKSFLPGELKRIFADALSKLPTTASIDTQASSCVAALIAFAPGDQLYIPMCDIDSRDLQVWQEFTGNNHAMLGMKYNTSERNIYIILERVQAAIDARNQPILPGVN